LVGKPEVKRPSEDLGIDGKILEWILGRWGEKVWRGCVWHRMGISGGPL